MDYCTDSLVLKALDLLHTAITVYGDLLAAAFVIALLAVVFSIVFDPNAKEY